MQPGRRNWLDLKATRNLREKPCLRHSVAWKRAVTCGRRLSNGFQNKRKRPSKFCILRYFHWSVFCITSDDTNEKFRRMSAKNDLLNIEKTGSLRTASICLVSSVPSKCFVLALTLLLSLVCIYIYIEMDVIEWRLTVLVYNCNTFYTFPFGDMAITVTN